MVEGEDAHIEGYSLADLAFQIGLSPEQPEGKNKEIEEVSPDQAEQGFYQQICFDQGPVEIDNQWKGRRLVRGSIIMMMMRMNLFHHRLMANGLG